MDRIPRVSFIIGIYNCAPTLQEALDSLYAQTYRNFEIILCDDGSTDDTYHIAEANARAHPGMITLLRNERNMKLAATLNRCISAARGEYLARMDGDDISHPERLARQVAFLDAHPEYDLVSTSFVRFDGSGEWMTCVGDVEPDKKSLIFGVPFNHPSCLMRKKAIAEIGNYTADPKVERAEDVYLWYKFFKAGKRGYVLPDILINYRDDRDAARRRRVCDRFRFARMKYEILGGLCLGMWRWVALYEAAKAFVPPVLVYKVKKFFSRRR